MPEPINNNQQTQLNLPLPNGSDSSAIDKFSGENLDALLSPPDRDMGEEASPEPEAKPDPYSEKFSQYDAKFDKLSEDLSVAQQTNQYLRGRLAEMAENRSTGQIAEKEQDQEFQFNEQELADGLANNAPKTIAKLVQDLVAHVTPQIERKLNSGVEQKFSQTRANEQRQTAYRNDVSRVNTEFGELMANKEFIAEADQEIADIIGTRGGRDLRDYQPGDLRSAAQAVAMKWIRQGKWTPGQANQENSNSSSSTSRPALREVLRTAPREENFNNNRNSSSRSNGPATTIDQLFTSDKDRRTAKEVARQMGIEEKAFVRSYLRAREEDSDFDR